MLSKILLGLNFHKIKKYHTDCTQIKPQTHGDVVKLVQKNSNAQEMKKSLFKLQKKLAVQRVS